MKNRNNTSCPQHVVTFYLCVGNGLGYVTSWAQAHYEYMGLVGFLKAYWVVFRPI